MKRPLPLVLLLAAVLTGACRNRPEPAPADMQSEGEPDRYAATVTRIVEDGAAREETVTRVAKSGEQWREEWSEAGEARALIWRPDLGKSFLLSLNRRLYVESDIHQSALPDETGPEAIERAMESAPAPVSVETRMLPDCAISGYTCKVVEKRANFADGHAEVTTSYRARDLGGLAVRTETETTGGPHNIRVITERRDIRLEVAPEEFTVPAGYVKVKRLPF